ncbi:MAG: acyl-CoA synthetase [Proteobacteria bacterium]|nr:acyl-CoA synthetase [Pseudomonadota bacterium]MCP4922138.1 acyl-CoA synthetase [Pseudomonadota bacterium]
MSLTFNLADLTESLADAIPDRRAVVCGDADLTFGQLDERATRLANHLTSLGISRGDHIGLYLYNCAEYIECMLAAWKLGAVTINVNYRYVGHELAYVYDNGDLKGLVFQEDLADQVEAAGLPAMTVRMNPGPTYEAALAAASAERNFQPRTGDELFIIYTGGTTGMPRGVMWRHEDIFFAALKGGNPGGTPIATPEGVAKNALEAGEGINIHPAAPMIHGSGQLASWISLLNGGVAALVPGRSFIPEESLRLAVEYDMSCINVVGDAMARPLADLLEAHPDRWDLSMLDAVASAGAILTGEVREKLERHLPNCMILNNFGASETGHQGTAFYEDGEAIWIMDEDNTCLLDEDLNRIEAGSDAIGRLARFGHIPLGYYGDPEKTAKTFFERDGVRYVIPGDMAKLAEDGTVVFLGRGSGCINTGGEKVFPEEVEEVLKTHPSVFDAVVVGLPDPKWGQMVAALVQKREGHDLDLNDLNDFCRKHIAGYKVPKAVHVLPDLNRHASGKPNYKWAKAQALELS